MSDVRRLCEAAMKRRQLDPIALLFMQERGAIRSVAVARRVPFQDHEDVVHDVLVAALRSARRGEFVVLGTETDVRESTRAFLRGVARRLIREQQRRARLERHVREQPEPFDPEPMFEARSDLRALDLSPVAVAFFQAVAFEGNVFRAAARMGWPVGTAYARREALRRDALAALRRIRRGT